MLSAFKVIYIFVILVGSNSLIRRRSVVHRFKEILPPTTFFSIKHPNLNIDIIPLGGIIVTMIADIKKRALHRAKILEGQMRGVQKMIENEDYCMDILTQNLAIQKSIGSLNKLILENHIRTHISESLASSNKKEREKAINELLELYELASIRGKNGS